VNLLVLLVEAVQLHMLVLMVTLLLVMCLQLTAAAAALWLT
jgi:hypothetical protein